MVIILLFLLFSDFEFVSLSILVTLLLYIYSDCSKLVFRSRSARLLPFVHLLSERYLYLLNFILSWIVNKEKHGLKLIGL
ncbi:hypothetical protein HQ45_00475 [Porphyromonas crevioricanis]|uniref:Uncharacterized protein n=1 Tax=Porphyromonas crevioricanis TaxID=393921 RepID=A0AB34PG30_9PORP|nr:hypothetical protein HQ45_00475 [Porphyromonas crevioricanis]KGN95387.1 hypothetical protein HQ38_03670 [Porphyromonas crevioricanis]